MARLAKPPGKSFIAIFLLYMVCFWISHGHAFESWLGELSTNVNLRTSPGLDQEIITVLEEAIIVEVIDENGEWYQVVTLWETPEHKGWVYRQHIRKTSNKEKTSEVPPVMSGEERKGKGSVVS